jgi:hypothetical protein
MDRFPTSPVTHSYLLQRSQAIYFVTRILPTKPGERLGRASDAPSGFIAASGRRACLFIFSKGPN